MKRLIAITIGALFVSTVQAETFVVRVTGVVQSTFGGQSGGALDAAQPGEVVTETYVFNTDGFPLVLGDGATTLSYVNPYLSPRDSIRSLVAVGGRVFSVEGYPLQFEGAGAVDSVVTQPPPPLPPLPPTDRFVVNDVSVTAALNVAGARGQIRWASFGAQAPGASSLVSVPITSLTNVRLNEATGMTSTLIEGVGLGLSASSFTFDIAITRLVTVTVQSATLQRCANRLHWLDAGQPWPKHGVHCAAGDDGDDDQD